MKRFFILALLPVMFLSCDRLGEKDVEIQATAEALSVFLNSNYSIGDKVVFEQEDGVIDTFRVKEVRDWGLYVARERPQRSYLKVYQYMTLFENERDTIWAAVETYLAQDNETIESVCRVQINHRNTNIWIDEKGACPFEIADDEWYSANQIGQWVILKRGIGIVKMADEKGRVWTLLKHEPVPIE